MDKKSWEYLHSIIDNIGDIITILEADGRIRFESQSIRSLGYDPEELVGRSVFDLVHPDDRAGVLAKFLAGVALPGHSDTVRLRFRHKQGDWISLEARAKNLLFDPRVKGIVICSRDLTERQTLHEQIQLQAEALQAAGNGILITDPKGLILWVNRSFTAMTGYELHEVLGKTPRILKSGAQDKSVYKDLWDTISSGKVWRGEVENRRKDGSVYPEQMVITPIRSQKGEIQYFVAVKEDISMRRKMEADMAQSQKMEAIGRFSGGVAHDFNNLLTVILGRCDFMAHKMQGEHPLRADLEEVRQAALRASAMTRQLLAFSRRQVLQPRVLELNDIISSTSLLVERLIGEDVRLSLNLASGMKPVKVDAGQIEQVLMNLAVNARDAMPGGGQLVISTRQVHLRTDTLDIHSGGDYAVLEVKDTGMGMSPEVKKRIFEPFFTTKDKGKGTGLGLSTVYGIINQSQGFIEVDSAPEAGSIFRIYLPAVDETPVALNPDQIPALPRGGSETLLVVEDQENVRRLAVSILERFGYKVLEASNGCEALQVVRNHREAPFHLVITDMIMPEMGGRELAENLPPLLPGVKVLFISGYTDHGMAHNELKEGWYFLQKPFRPAELLGTIRRILDEPRCAA